MFHKKRMSNVDTNNLSSEATNLILYIKKGKKKRLLILPKSSLETHIIKMLEFFLLATHFCLVGVFFNIVGIHMGTNCAPLLTNMFLYSYEADFIQSSKKMKRS